MPRDRCLAAVRAHVSHIFVKMQHANRVQIAVCVHEADVLVGTTGSQGRSRTAFGVVRQTACFSTGGAPGADR